LSTSILIKAAVSPVGKKPLCCVPAIPPNSEKSLSYVLFLIKKTSKICGTICGARANKSTASSMKDI
jgi:hypothetical protein